MSYDPKIPPIANHSDKPANPNALPFGPSYLLVESNPHSHRVEIRQRPRRHERDATTQPTGGYIRKGKTPSLFIKTDDDCSARPNLNHDAFHQNPLEGIGGGVPIVVCFFVKSKQDRVFDWI